MNWNSITAQGGLALAHSLRRNNSLEILHLSMNAIADASGFGFAICLLFNRSLKTLNISSNNLSSFVASILADSLQFNRGLENLDLSQNPIGDQGVHQLLQSIKHRKKPMRFGLKNIAGKPIGSHEYPQLYDEIDPTGFYELNLQLEWNQAIAQLLWFRSLRGDGTLNNVVYKQRKIHSTRKWQIPTQGILKFDYRAKQTDVVNDETRETIHFKLDLSLQANRHMLQVLIERAITEPGENWKNESLNGALFEFDEDNLKQVEWLKSLTSGIFQVDYLSTALQCEKHYVYVLQ